MTTSVKLTPSDKVGNARFGCSMALSADGKTAVIGGFGDNNMKGAVWVFIHDEGNWVQKAKLVPADAASFNTFGSSVAMSADGYTVLVGGRGAAWKFSLSDDGVWRQTLTLTSTSAFFGFAVALSYDGSVSLVSAIDDNQTGSVNAYTHLGETSMLAARLLPPDPTVKNFGASVALSADGGVALIGASGRGNEEGSAWVFTSTDAPSGSGKVWTDGVKLPERSDRGNNFGFGYSAALSADGNVALVGSFGNALDPHQSGAWVFTNSNGVWTQQGPKLAVSNPYNYGQSVALSADGATALISDWSMSTGGVGWLFTLDANAWKLQGQALTGSPNQFKGFSIGGSVALSAAGTTYLVCGFDQDIDGTAFLFDEGSWEISHIFVLMLENHSFDNIFGLSGIPGIISTAATQSNTYNGQNYPVPKSTFAPASMPTDPAHEFADIMEQQCGLDAQKAWVNGQSYPAITNTGYVSNYATSRTEIHSGNPVIPTADQFGEIMKCFNTPVQLPVIYQLATEFALCDQWFSSLPGPTFPNRAFLHGGSSSGLADSPDDSSPVLWLAHGFKHAHGNIFAALRSKGLVWQIFVDPPNLGHFVPPPVCLLQGIHYLSTSGFSTFADSVKSPTYPEGYTFIEPNYGEVFSQSFKNGSSQHPMDGTYGGELLLKKTYEAIRNSPHWEKSLLIITYDEHGGYFDSGTPGTAPAPNDNPTKNKEFDYSRFTNFDFKQLGVRVPAIVVSPRVQKGTIDHTVYDHTSVLATIEHFFNLKPLTERDAAATPIRKLLGQTIRTDCPTELANPVAPPVTLAAFEVDPLVEQQPLPASGNVHGFLATLVKTDLELTPHDEAARAKILADFKLIRTVGDARAYAQKVGAKVESMRSSRNGIQTLHVA